MSHRKFVGQRRYGAVKSLAALKRRKEASSQVDVGCRSGARPRGRTHLRKPRDI